MGPPSATAMSPRSKSARRPRHRFDGGNLRAYRSPGATRFSSDPEFGDQVFVIRALKQFPHIIDPLIQETTVKYRDGRPCSEGSWALVMMAFAMSGHTEYKTFRDSWKSSPIWRGAS